MSPWLQLCRHNRRLWLTWMCLSWCRGWRSWSRVKLDLFQEGQSSKAHTKEVVAGGTGIPNQSSASIADRRAISGKDVPSLKSQETLGVRGYTLRGTRTANPTHHAQAPGVEGCTLRGKDAANPLSLQGTACTTISLGGNDFPN